MTVMRVIARLVAELHSAHFIEVFVVQVLIVHNC